MKFSWKTAVTVITVVAVGTLVFFGIRKDSQPEVGTENSYSNASELSGPIPEATGEAEGIATGMFLEMDQEFGAVSAQMDESSSNASNGNNELNTFTYAEEEF